MKRILLYILILGAVLLVPVERTDVGKLQPVQTVAVFKDDDQYVIQTDTEDVGYGRNLQEAFDDLIATTSAVIYLDTAEYLLLDEAAEANIEELRSVLKPTISLYRFENVTDLKETSKFLSTKEKGPSLKSWEKGVVLPVLRVKNKRMILDEKT